MTHLFTDNEYQLLVDRVFVGLKLTLNLITPDEHVSETGRSIRVIKECLRAIITTLPFRIITKVIKRENDQICRISFEPRGTLTIHR